MTPKRILLTGASGSIGKHALRFLSQRPDEVEIICLIHQQEKVKKAWQNRNVNIQFVKGDVTVPATLEKITENIDVAIHLAGILPPVADKQPALANAVNVDGTANLVKALERNSPNATIVYASSVAIYGDRVSNPHIYVNDPITPSYGDEYARTKVKGEEVLKESKLNWTIFRLAGIMDPERNKPEAIMFHVPLKTSFEICTTRDCGRALSNSLDHLEKLSGRVFNLGGGEKCRGYYEEYLNRTFELVGLGSPRFPEGTFATSNFHCGYYMDGDELEDIIKFRKDTKEDFFRMMDENIPNWQKAGASLVRPLVYWGLRQISEPYQAMKKKDPKGLKQYFNMHVDESRNQLLRTV